MADKKITALTALGTTDVDPAADLLHIIDYSASPVNKKITVANLFDQVNTNTSIYGASKSLEVGYAAATNAHLSVTVGATATADGAVTINDDGVAYVDFVVKSLSSNQAIKVDAGTDDILINGDSHATADFTVKGGTLTNIYSDGGLDCVGIGTHTVDGTGTLTVAADGTTGHGILNAGNLVMSGAPGAVVAGGVTGTKTAIPLTTSISYLSAASATNADYFTLAAGTTGQFKTLICTTGTGTVDCIITGLGIPIHGGTNDSTTGGTANIVLHLGYQEAVLLQYLNAGWAIVGGGIQAGVAAT
jgi:hypothetical protein